MDSFGHEQLASFGPTAAWIA